jgi:hypothetical protein
MIAYSQNGGQLNENNVLKIEYHGYINGSYAFTLKNKANCQTVVKVDKNGVVSNYTLSALQTVTFLIIGSPTEIIKFRAKRESGANCIQNPNNGWVEQRCLTVVPVKFLKISATAINANRIKLQFESEEDLDLSHYNIKLSYDAINYKQVMLLFPNGIVGKKQYTLYINL